MSRGVNKAIIIGNLGQDPDTKYTASGTAVTNLSVATSESWKDKQTGQMQDRTEWHKITLYNRLAEVAGEYLRKGSKVYIEGKLQTRKWQDQGGNDRYSTEIIANEMQMLDSAGDNPKPGSAHSNQQNASSASSQGKTAASRSSAPPPDMDSFDEQIPF